ncbi:hypothetical protein [Bosea sp. RAC05]|uniref:hypothetical protein n=1 Tax=Bosea sp. RAC05 TaxID=1842539 RepID=UPI000857A4AC|nr:hypothetical protein [Bosea sp. RAC05]AOG02966.1 hypothetical protein BSY19_4875 [Bosea sp. RAC05]
MNADHIHDAETGAIAKEGEGPPPDLRARAAAVVAQADASGRDGWMAIEVPDEISRDGYLRIPRAPFEQWALSRTIDGASKAQLWTPVCQPGDPGVHDRFLADWLLGAGFNPADIQPGGADPVMDAFRASVLAARARIEKEVLARSPRPARPERNEPSRPERRHSNAIPPARGRPNPMSKPSKAFQWTLEEDCDYARLAEKSDFIGYLFRLPSVSTTIVAQVMHMHEDADDGYLIVRAEPIGEGQASRSYYGPLRTWSQEDVRAAAWLVLERVEA